MTQERRDRRRRDPRADQVLRHEAGLRVHRPTQPRGSLRPPLGARGPGPAAHGRSAGGVRGRTRSSGRRGATRAPHRGLTGDPAALTSGHGRTPRPIPGDTDAIDNPFAMMDPEMAANPQPVFKALRESVAGPRRSTAWACCSIAAAEIDEAFRHPEIFSSNMSAVDLCNIRPLIPLQIDPPRAQEVPQDPRPDLRAPSRWRCSRSRSPSSVNDLIDGFIERGEVDFAAEFSIPFPSQVFLTLLGLPARRAADASSRMKDGIIRPDRRHRREPRGSADDRRTSAQTAASIYEYFERGARRARRPSVATTSSAASSTPRSTASG